MAKFWRAGSAFLFMAFVTSTAWGATNTHADKPSAQKLKWFNDAKFGMFIHWGPYSVASIEASWPIIIKPEHSPITHKEYLRLPTRFNPTKFNPRAWMKLAKKAGQKYVVFTAKHHDGFAMFDANNMDDYKITRTPYGRDIFGELANAAKEEDIPLGVYYSPPDLHHKGYRDTSKGPWENFNGEPDRPEWPTYLDHMEGHLRQLLTSYGDIAVVWFDWLNHERPELQEKYDGPRFHALLRELQPNALVNNRLALPGDFFTPEQVIPETWDDPERPWETCMTINNTWGHNKMDLDYKSAESLIWRLIEVASKGGNFLLNVGPDANGEIQPEFEERLLKIGAWLEKNGEAIYGTKAGPKLASQDLRTTAKGKHVYVHFSTVTSAGGRVLSGLDKTVRRAWVVATGERIRVTSTSAGPELQLPKSLKNVVFPVIALELR